METFFMKLKMLSIYAASSILLNMSCVSHRHIFSKETFSNFYRLKVNEATTAEIKNGSRDISPTYLVSIGESIYPNSNNYKLEKPRTFKRIEKRNFEIEVGYFYTARDSSVKVILYEWDELSGKKRSPFENERNLSKKFRLFQNKFDELSERLTKELGLPYEKSIEQNKSEDKTFRDGIKWEGQNGLNGYLFMFGNNKNGYRQIRLAIYGN